MKKTPVKKKNILTPFLVTAILLIAGGICCFRNLLFPDYKSAVSVESARELNNPYIGWYQIYPYTLSEAAFDPALIPEQTSAPGLVMLQFNLSNYAHSTIGKAGLKQLGDILDAWHSTGKQLIIRFLYDWDGLALEKEPESLALVLEHMSQAAEVVNLHSDCVYILQGIFVGAWGEMHSSNYMDEENMLTLIRHLASVTSPDIFLAVRTPEQWRTIAKTAEPLSPENAYDGSLTARLSLFNDGMLGSDTDLGTYGESGSSSSSDFGKRPRQTELLFQEALCRFVPNGGEVVIDNPYNDLPYAVEDLARMHVSYLNKAYDETVFSKWREDTFQGKGPFQGMNGYDYVSRHLGYRYVLRSSAFSLETPWAKEAGLSIVMENTGFSNSYKLFDVWLTVKNTDSGEVSTVPVPTDTRLWNAGSLFQLDITLDVSGFRAGTYEIFLHIQDPSSGYPIYLANEGAEYENGCFAGTLTFQKFPQWDFLISALIGKAQDISVGFSPQQ